MSMRLKFLSKAETLASLAGHLRSARIPKLRTFTIKEWRDKPKTILGEIAEAFIDCRVIVRSSASSEDSHTSSHAGEFLSIAHLNSADSNLMQRAIEQVIASYGRTIDTDLFFVQAQIQDISMCGVACTREVDTLAPYIVINYDCSGSHDKVTSGQAANLTTYIRFKNSPLPIVDTCLRKVVNLSEELEAIFGNDSLDIEFAVTSNHDLYLLQVRPIVVAGKPVALACDTAEDLLAKLYKKIEKLNGPHPGIHGKRAIYSVMTDWNPAEMIGQRPRPLALSLYKDLITDSIWAYQRSNYGYRDLRGFPLLVCFLGAPYIDVRASLNSFVPAQLDEQLSSKLVDFYTERLIQNPTQHDKVEFSIVYACYYLNLSTKLATLIDHGFSALDLDRIKFGLLGITNKVICGEMYKGELRRLQTLQERFSAIESAKLPDIDHIYWLLEDCRRFGTLPFAGLARCGFIAIQFLNSFVDLGIMTLEEKAAFMGSLNTVTRQLARDLRRARENELPWSDFMAMYGHLRPGTYDILSARYDQAFEAYFGGMREDDVVHEPFTFTNHQLKEIADHLRCNGLECSAESLITFMRAAIEGREYGKFIFTRSLSKVLELVAGVGERFGLAREEMSYVDIKTLLSMYSSVSSRGVKDVLLGDIQRGLAEYELTRSLKFPELIVEPSQVYDFYLGETEPNFVTQGRITEIVVSEENLTKTDLSGRIVMIRSADPGYDWLFARGIGGLITMFGGVNSHMAIRCAELQIPAVVGCGERNFREWAQSKTVEIDCSNKTVRPIVQ
jgi:hypothetical protein